MTRDNSDLAAALRAAQRRSIESGTDLGYAQWLERTIADVEEACEASEALDRLKAQGRPRDHG